MSSAERQPVTSAGAGTTTSLQYSLRCKGCNALFEDDGFLLECPHPHDRALLVTEPEQTRFEPDDNAEGLFRYSAWLPSRRALPGVAGPVTYQSEALSKLTGLPHLWITFNGYWPEKDAGLETGTFKELEAWTVLSRLPEGDDSVLVIASAGNTAAAFARVCSLFEVPCLIIVPEAALAALRLVEPMADHVKIVSLGGLADYYDAIQLAARVSQFDGFVAEGGVWNVARRDGLGTVVLDAVEKIGRLPDYYFQAVGSGAGGIAAYEAANKLLGDGRFGSTPPRLMLAQNAPFAPIYHSWKTGERKLVEFSDDAAKLQVQQLCAHVLSNRRPPFATTGGIYDALSDTGGDALIAGNDDVGRAGRLFEETEGIDVDPAASVAFAALLQAVGDDRVQRDAVTLLNVTGGGRRRLMQTLPLMQAHPMLELLPEDLGRDDTAARVAELFDG